MNNIIDSLNALGAEANDRFPDLNCGGCCVFAQLVADKLAERGIEAHGIVAMSDWEDAPSIDAARSNVEDVSDGWEWNDNGIEFNHVGVSFAYEGTEYHYDSNGAHEPHGDLSGWGVVPGYLSRYELFALAGKPHNWSIWFDRGRIPELKALVEEYL